MSDMNITIEEAKQLLASGKTFSMTEDIEYFHKWSSVYDGKRTYQGVGDWDQLEVDEDKVNYDSKVRVFVRNWRVIGWFRLELFVEQYNKGLWKMN